MNRCNSPKPCNRNIAKPNIAKPRVKTENKKERVYKIKVPDIKDFNAFDELSSDVMEDVDIINEIIGKYDRRTTDHIIALTFHWYKARRDP